MQRYQLFSGDLVTAMLTKPDVPQGPVAHEERRTLWESKRPEDKKLQNEQLREVSRSPPVLSSPFLFLSAIPSSP